jgi:hypothetical protein
MSTRGRKSTRRLGNELERLKPSRPRNKKRPAGRTRRSRAVKRGPAEADRPEEAVIPWSYGVDRVRAMAVDPERLFVYWEVTDEAIQRAREKLGPGGPGAWPALRVYDTTGRIFDGTNAHGYFDHGVDRGERQWFFDIGKPASEAVVELGLKSREGYFVKIVRSGRVEFPRRGPLPAGSQQWLTVRIRDGQPHLASDSGDGAIGSSDPAPRSIEGPGGVQASHDGGRSADPTEFERAPVRIEQGSAERSAEEMRVVRWRGAGTWRSWETGPFTYHVDASGPSTESFVGGMRVYRSAAGTHVVYGPWEVVIRGIGAYRRRAVLARWEIHRAWISEEGHELRGSVPVEGQLMAGSSASVRFGASERRWLAGSESRLAGASELLWLGASERRLGGASERMYLAASEWLMSGASERRFRGASERRLGGASERLARGASETRPGAQLAYPRVDRGSDIG